MFERLLAPAALETMVRLAGIAQLLLVALSPAIPKALGWRAELQGGVKPLTRQVFWTWAAYIWLTHLAFGLLSTFGGRLLVEPTLLAGLLSAFIAAWWGARLVIQFTVFDRTAAPPGLIYRVGEGGLIALFIVLTSVYGAVTFANFARPT